MDETPEAHKEDVRCLHGIVLCSLHSKVTWNKDLCHIRYTAKKEKVTLTLLRLSQLQSNDTVSLPIELPFLLYIPDSMCVMCRVSPEHNQSNVCYGRNLTCDR